jgi:hypothetical protein
VRVSKPAPRMTSRSISLRCPLQSRIEKGRPGSRHASCPSCAASTAYRRSEHRCRCARLVAELDYLNDPEHVTDGRDRDQSDLYQAKDACWTMSRILPAPYFSTGANE